MADWPKKPYYWAEADTGFASIPFTWNLPEVRSEIEQSLFWHKWIVGGPAVELAPDYFADMHEVAIGHNMPGVLQRINPDATRTTVGCPNQCAFCAVPCIEPEYGELDDWPDKPILCDNNLLAATAAHFDRVCDRLEKHPWCDFEQGLDARLLSEHHAKRLARLPQAMVRLSLDHTTLTDEWITAYAALPANMACRRLVFVRTSSSASDQTLPMHGAAVISSTT